jgi:ABC-type polysaccharide/polyol phosphate export permease
MWQGDLHFVLKQLVLKDFKVRYRNMSLGMLWSLLNPLVMMGVLTFVFTKIFPNPQEGNFPIFFLCGLVPYNFFCIAWLSGTMSLVQNSGLIKRVPVPREVIPIASVFSTGLQMLIQIALLLSLVLIFGRGVNIHWLWLPVIWGFELIFVCGLVLIFSALDVYIRDTRYVVESAYTVLFWLVPIFYSFAIIPERFREIYQFNPVAALVLASRDILLQAQSPAQTLLLKLAASSCFMLLTGFLVFRILKRRFYNYL